MLVEFLFLHRTGEHKFSFQEHFYRSISNVQTQHMKYTGDGWVMGIGVFVYTYILYKYVCTYSFNNTSL